MKDSTRTALQWGATFLAFPVGGLVARWPGPVDSVPAALLAGAVAGTVIGAAHALVLARGVRRRLALTAASLVGVGLGLALGGRAVAFATSTSDLVLQGLLSGAVLGLAQAVALWVTVGPRVLAWPLLTAVAWALGWWTTSSVGVDVERQYAVFGASGALLATAVTGVGVVLARRTPVRSA